MLSEGCNQQEQSDFVSCFFSASVRETGAPGWLTGALPGTRRAVPSELCMEFKLTI